MAGEVRATKRVRYSGKTVTIMAGFTPVFGAAAANPDLVTNWEFQIHEEVLKQSSPYFCAALEDERKDGSARIVKVLWATVFEVGAYVDWCYSGEIASKEIASEAVDGTRSTSECRNLARLYVFGEKVRDVRFCNAVITAFTQLCDQPGFMASHTFGAVTWIYTCTTRESPARRFMVDIWQGYGKTLWLLEGRAGDLFNPVPDFLVDLVAALYRRDFQRTAGDKFFPCRFRWFKSEQGQSSLRRDK